MFRRNLAKLGRSGTRNWVKEGGLFMWICILKKAAKPAHCCSLLAHSRQVLVFGVVRTGLLNIVIFQSTSIHLGLARPSAFWPKRRRTGVGLRGSHAIVKNRSLRLPVARWHDLCEVLLLWVLCNGNSSWDGIYDVCLGAWASVVSTSQASISYT